MTAFPTTKYLNINNGPGAWRQFLVDLALGLLSFAEAGIEFKTGVSTPFPKRPTTHDLLDDLDSIFDPFNLLTRPPTHQTTTTQLNLSTASTMPQPSTPFAASAAESKTPTADEDDDIELNIPTTPQTPSDLPALVKLPDLQYKYRHLPNSQLLTDIGHSDLRQDQKSWDSKFQDLQDKRRDLTEYIFSICHADSMTALNSHPEFMPSAETLNVVKLHEIFRDTHTQDNAVISLNTIYAFIHCSQGTKTLDEFALDVKTKTTNLITQFEDNDHPGYIRTSLLVNCVLIKGVNNEMKPLINNLLTSSTSNLRQMTETSILASFRKFKPQNPKTPKPQHLTSEII